MAHVTDLFSIPEIDSLRYTPKYSRERLDSLRFDGDPLADLVAAELHSNHGGLTNIHDLLSTVREKAETCEGVGGDIFREFLSSIAAVPSWADEAKIERGQRIHAVHTPFMGISLFSGRCRDRRTL